MWTGQGSLAGFFTLEVAGFNGMMRISNHRKQFSMLHELYVCGLGNTVRVPQFFYELDRAAHTRLFLLEVLMNLYHAKFKDRKTGQVCETPRWYVDFRDHIGKRQRFAGVEDEHDTEELGRMLEDLANCRKRSIQPPEKLWTWLMSLDVKTQAKLVKMDLADKAWFVDLSQGERLSTWVDDYETWLTKSKGKNGYHRNKVYIQTTVARVRSIVKGCGFKTWADIRKAAIETYLGGLDVASGTHNGYCTAFKQFCTWAVKDERAEYSPAQYLDRVRVPNKEKRRPLAFDEVCQLLETTSGAGRRLGMTGIDRAILYRLGIETGFRANELRNLTVDCFDLDKATVHLDAQYCKDRRDASQPITMALACSLKPFLADRDSKALAFNMTQRETARMLKEDAIRAGLPLTDEKGRELVFHSLRHTLRTELVRTRATEAVTDKIMRHKPNGVGATFYGHVTDFEIRSAIEKLPEYPWPELSQTQSVKAVG